ncbi:MAG: hypothetical protein J7L66_05485, partial [Anaerolineaceae bacterium]|nr:hypothetical protein [Anaerolineaceae bacterium]
MAAGQLEIMAVLDNMDSIFSTPHLYMVLVEPLDPSLSLGLDFFPGEPSPLFNKALASILAASLKYNVPLGIFCSSAEIARKRIAQGFLFVNIALDTDILTESVRRALKVKG